MYYKLISRKFFEVGVNFRHYHTVKQWSCTHLTTFSHFDTLAIVKLISRNICQVTNIFVFQHFPLRSSSISQKKIISLNELISLVSWQNVKWKTYVPSSRKWWTLFIFTNGIFEISCLLFTWFLQRCIDFSSRQCCQKYFFWGRQIGVLARANWSVRAPNMKFKAPPYIFPFLWHFWRF